MKYRDFINNHLIQDRVIRQMERIGEGTKKLSNDTRQHPEIPWRNIAGLGGKPMRGRSGVDLDASWEGVERDIPVLKRKLTSLTKNRSRP